MTPTAGRASGRGRSPGDPHARLLVRTRRRLAAVVLLLVGIKDPSPQLQEGAHCVGALQAIAAAQGRPFNPQPGTHEKPPKDWTCSRTGTGAHKCDCHRECADDGQGGIQIAEDTQCKVFCYADHCHCPVKNCP